jgi:hypothetical protein
VQRQLLYTLRLEVTHPRSGERMKWEAELPGDFQEIIERLSTM